jgi:predicted metalloprotease with PDZ domain
MFLRRESGGRYKLDDLMRYLYRTYYKRGKGLPEEGVLEGVVHLLGAEKRKVVEDFWRSYVEGREQVSYKDFLTGLPIAVEEAEELAQGWARIGIRRWSQEGEGIRIVQVEPLSAAARLGLSQDDIIYTVDGKSAGDLDPAFWDSLKDGARVPIGWRREDEVVDEGVLYFTARQIPRQKRLRLTPTKEGFGTSD